MRILLVNDDGFHAPGFEVLRKIAAELSNDVWAVAPEKDQSGQSHSISLSKSLHFTKHSERDISVTGTPVDCVILGVKEFMPSPPDLILSGVNHGLNAANYVSYSGTAAAAKEGAFLGIRSFALSLRVDWASDGITHWETPEKYAPPLIKRSLSQGFDPSTFININFPDRKLSDVRGEKLVPQGWVDHRLYGEPQTDDEGKAYYRLAFQDGVNTRPEGDEIRELRDGYVTVTPMRPNYTDHATLDAFVKNWGEV